MLGRAGRRGGRRSARLDAVSPAEDNGPLALSRTALSPADSDIIPVFRPLLPRAERLLPYLQRIDETRLYANHGPLLLELERRLADALALPPGGIVCASSGTA